MQLGTRIDQSNINLFLLSGIYGHFSPDWVYDSKSVDKWFLLPKQPIKPKFNLATQVARSGQKLLGLGLLDKKGAPTSQTISADGFALLKLYLANSLKRTNQLH